MHKILFYNKFISCLYMFRAPCVHRQEVKIVLYSLWYHHTYRWPSGARDGTAMYVSPNIKLRSCNHCCNGEAISVINSQSVLVALFIKHVKLMRLLILSPMACLALRYFSTLSHKRRDFWKKKFLGHKTCVFIFPTILSKTFLIIRIIERDIINLCWSSSNVTVATYVLNECWIFSKEFRRIHNFQCPWKSVQWEPSSSMRTDGQIDIQTDRQTDMTKLIVAFRNVSNAPEMCFKSN